MSKKFILSLRNTHLDLKVDIPNNEKKHRNAKKNVAKKSFTCPLCEKVMYSRKDRLRQHVKNKTDSKHQNLWLTMTNTVCDECGKNCHSLSGLTKHQNYVCPQSKPDLAQNSSKHNFITSHPLFSLKIGWEIITSNTPESRYLNNIDPYTLQIDRITLDSMEDNLIAPEQQSHATPQSHENPQPLFWNTDPSPPSQDIYEYQPLDESFPFSFFPCLEIARTQPHDALSWDLIQMYNNYEMDAVYQYLRALSRNYKPVF